MIDFTIRVELTSRMLKISDTGSDFLPRVYVAGREIAKGVAKRKYGGAEAAYERALEILAELQAQYPRPNSPLPRLPFYKTPQRTSKHGWSGISRSTKKGRNGWEGTYFGVVHTNEYGERTQTAFYLHHYRSEEEALRAAVVFRIDWELEQLKEYEAHLRAWFAEVNAEPWAELLAVLADLRAERQAVLANGGRPQPLARERQAPAVADKGPTPRVIQPVTTRVNPRPAEDLGLLPDEDFVLSL